MSDITLYHAGLSPCAHKVRLVLVERKIPFEGRHIDLMSKENLEPEYLKINPKGLVPALIDKGTVVTESTVICEYLEDAYPDNPLMPEDPIKRAQVRYMLKLVDESLHINMMPIVFGAVVRYIWLAKPEQERKELLSRIPDPLRRARQERMIDQGLDAEDVKPAVAIWHRSFAGLENRLAKSEWLAGDEHTLADCAVAPYVYAMKYLKVDEIFRQFPKLNDWMNRIIDRPSFEPALMPYVPQKQWDHISTFAEKSKQKLNLMFSQLDS
ncbi:glutathione S-transferase family protein [Pseudomaricurvus alkylphenolicus]|jgi:glutathione S-transferase|uniref:glutathione S-transferase family protein n=1 Tax=Pseudomaricurvus alkylphenolicus TaxID=1306991 RepID=UPI0014224A20|nr:glutathione S-transferase family protein [Pseudomaricurvus alkylphenolicus]NIB42318.1 glutathione S-transferase family protein [Pseudomaricurvus alkylphenolicus]